MRSQDERGHVDPVNLEFSDPDENAATDRRANGGAHPGHRAPTRPPTAAPDTSDQSRPPVLSRHLLENLLQASSARARRLAVT